MVALLVENALVIGMSAEDDITPRGHVLVEDGRIAALGSAALSRAADLGPAGVERLDAEGLWLLPGFVQTHIHLCQTLLRNGPDDLELLPWLKSHVWPGEAAHDEASLDVSSRLGLAELLAGGTTSILDMGTVRHTDAVFRAAARSGMRVTSGNALMDDPETNPADLFAETDAGLAETDRLFAAWHGREEGRLRVAYTPRFAISCTERCLIEAGERAREKGTLLHTHASENLGEIDFVMGRTGRLNVRYLDDLGLMGPNVVLAHVVHAGGGERELLAEKRTTVAHCPSSNLKLGSGICPVPEYLEMGIRVTLGADGAPCNDRLDAFTEMRLAALLPKTRLGPDALTAYDVVRMATAEGAAALGWHDCGTIAAGKRADFVLLDPDAGFARPTSWRDDPYGPLVYSFDRSNVVATYVDGIRRFHRGGTDSAYEAWKPTAREIETAAAALRSRKRASP